MRLTIYIHLNTWSDHWKENLVNLGFGLQVPGNCVVKVNVPEDQKEWV